MTILNNYPTSAGFIGVALEAIKGTGVASTSWLPLLEDGITHEPGLITPQIIRRSRNPQFFGVQTEQKVGGKISVPFYVDQGIVLLAACIGNDTFQSNGASSGSVALSASPAAGATTITIAAQTSPAIVANDYVEIRQSSGAASTTNLSEIHKVLSVSGAGPVTVTLAASESLVRAYTSPGAVYRIAGATTAFTHYLYPDMGLTGPDATYYRTLTVEKNRAGLDSRQHAGSTVGKFDLKMTTKDIAKVDYEISSLTDGSVTASTPTFINSAPLALPNLAVTAFGSPDTSMTDVELSIDNGVKEYYTFANNTLPAVAPPLMRKITGKWTNIVQDAVYYSNSINATAGNLILNFTQGANSVVFTLPKIQISKLSDPLKLGEVFMYDVEFLVVNDATSGTDISVAVTNSTYLPIA